MDKNIAGHEIEELEGTLTLTLARALTYKKRVVARIAVVEAEVKANNSFQEVEGAESEVPVADRVRERERLVNHLLDFKMKMFAANGPIQLDILRLAEYKGEIAWLNTLPTLHGTKPNPYMYGDKSLPTIQYTAIVRKAVVEIRVKGLTADIDAAQERIDAHNHTTTITVANVGL